MIKRCGGGGKVFPSGGVASEIFVCSFVSYTHYLLSAYYVLGTVLGTGDQMDMVPALMELKAKVLLVMTKHNSQLTFLLPD